MLTDPARSPWRQASAEVRARLIGVKPIASDGNVGAVQTRAVPASASHLWTRTTVDRLLALFILASIPAALVGAWQAGEHALANFAADPSAGGWRIAMVTHLGLPLAPGEPFCAFVVGMTFLVPLIMVASAVSIAWEIAFAALRRRPPDPGWPMTAWLFVLLLPAHMPLVLAAAGMSFAAVFGSHIFGGTGRYIASPALLGALFLQFAYPDISVQASTWSAVAQLASAGQPLDAVGWLRTFAGDEHGLLGSVSALACVAGAGVLVAGRLASLRTLGGALLGVVIAAAIANASGNSLPAHWHFATGGLAFCWAFVLTDPTTLPLTRAGRWLHGGLFGLLIVLMRHADPTHPESSLFAVLLAGLAVPLIDYVVLLRHRPGTPLEIER